MLVISQLFAPEMGALPNRLSPLTRHLGAHGHDVYVATGMPNYPRGEVFPAYRGRRFMREELEGATVLRTAYFTTPRNVSKQSQLLSYLSFLPAVLYSGWRAGRVDAVFVTSPPIFPALPAIVLAKLRRAKLLVDLRDLWPDEVIAVGAAREGSLPVRVLRLIERSMYRSADIVTCTTPAFADTVAERGVGEEKSRLLPNGADLELFRPLPRENEVAAQYDFGDRLVVMYSGLLGIKHGLETLIEAAALLRDRADVVFFVRGEGPRREALEAQARELGLTNVIFGGERPIEEVPYLLARADVCVTNLLPDAYLEKIVSVKVFEYLACEKPVVGGLRGEGARVLEESGGGVAVEPRRRAGDGGRGARVARRAGAPGGDGRVRPALHRAAPFACSDCRTSRGAAGRGHGATQRQRVKLVYVTSSLPHGPLEAFVLPEVAALERLGHEVWIVPMWPRGERVHADAEAFETRTLSEPLLSRAVLASAAHEVRPAPLARMLRSRPRPSPRTSSCTRRPSGSRASCASSGPTTSTPTGSRRAQPSRWSPPSGPGSPGA